MRFEDMTVEGRVTARRLREKLCELTSEYKGVKAEACVECESRCAHGRELLQALGMELEPEEKAEPIFDRPVAMHDARTRKVIRGINRRWRG